MEPGDANEKLSILGRIVALAVGVRVALWVLGAISVATATNGPVPWLGLWSRWDASHFLRVAEVGYPRSGHDALFIVFLPLFPLAVRIVAFVVRNYILSGLLVSFGASVGAGWFLYRLVRLDADHDEAWRAVVWLFAFPTAYFLAAPYSESLFLLAILACAYAARKDRWGAVALAGAAATATRLQAVALLPGLAFHALSRPTWQRRFRALIWVTLATTGFLAYLAINQIVHHDPFHFVDVQDSHWFNRAAVPWKPLMDAYHGLTRGAHGDTAIVLWGRVGATLFAIVALVAGFRRLKIADEVYGWIGLVLILASSWLISMPRYLLGLYPLFIVAAYYTGNRWLRWSLLPISVAAQAFFFWRYARGAWTF